MGKINSKQKGKNGELEFAKICREQGFEEAKRSVQYCGINGDADITGLPKIHAEVKRVERLNIDKAMEQAIRDCKKGNIPVVFHRKNRKDWKVTMLLQDWFKFYKCYLKNRNIE